VKEKKKPTHPQTQNSQISESKQQLPDPIQLMGFSFSFNPCFDQNSPMTINLEKSQNPPKKNLRQKTQQQHLANKKQN
jgi:hypothetical protein